jgi:hypothetical protein
MGGLLIPDQAGHCFIDLKLGFTGKRCARVNSVWP